MRQRAAPDTQVSARAEPSHSKPDRQKRAVMRNLPDFSIPGVRTRPKIYGFPILFRVLVSLGRHRRRDEFSALLASRGAHRYGRSLERGRSGESVASPQEKIRPLGRVRPKFITALRGRRATHSSKGQKRVRFDFFSANTEGTARYTYPPDAWGEPNRRLICHERGHRAARR
jgi:hypothetical protein